ncbi:retropepsin-like aspartic protease [Stenotrophomonas sp. PUT21]|uniref:retropepsin-like aspartic protease n=1 Tax=Stenotrophomonas TaxID=40323 RepID=UPI003B7F7E98
MRMWGLGLCVAILPATVAADPVALHDGFGYSDAVLRAELATLREMSGASGPRRHLGAAGYHRVRGELAASNRAARQCLDETREAPPTLQGLAFLCESTLAGNALIEGDIAAWASLMLRVREDYQRTIVPMLRAGDEVPDVTRPTFAAFTTWPRSALPVAERVQDVAVPIQFSNELPSVTLTLHGTRDGAPVAHEAAFIIDTGAPRSHISRGLAASLGLAVTEGFVVSRIVEGDIQQAGLAAPIDIELGGQRVRDVSFNSEPTRELNLIGLDVLRALGRFRLSRETLTLLGTQTPALCTRRMVVTSSLWGPFQQARYPIRGREHHLMLIDTGFHGAFQMRGAPRASVPAAAIQRRNVITTRGAEDIEYAPASTPMQITDTLTSIPVDIAFQPPDLFPSSWRIGYGVTGGYDVALDLPGGLGCLVPRPPEPPLLGRPPSA